MATRSVRVRGVRAGHDVAREPRALRRAVGAPQFATVLGVGGREQDGSRERGELRGQHEVPRCLLEASSRHVPAGVPSVGRGTPSSPATTLTKARPPASLTKDWSVGAVDGQRLDVAAVQVRGEPARARTRACRLGRRRGPDPRQRRAGRCCRVEVGDEARVRAVLVEAVEPGPLVGEQRPTLRKPPGTAMASKPSARGERRGGLAVRAHGVVRSADQHRRPSLAATTVAGRRRSTPSERVPAAVPSVRHSVPSYRLAPGVAAEDERRADAPEPCKVTFEPAGDLACPLRACRRSGRASGRGCP